MNSQTEKLREWIADFEVDIFHKNYGRLGIEAYQCTPIWTANRILLKMKEAGLIFARTGVRGDDLEGASICKFEEIDI